MTPRSMAKSVLVAAVLTVVVAASLYVRTGLVRDPGFDPLVGFLFSPEPLLRLASALQLMGVLVAVAGGLMALKWSRTP